MARLLLLCAAFIAAEPSAFAQSGNPAAGTIISGTAATTNTSEAQRKSNGYYAWRNGCYIQRADGAWMQVNRKYCV